MQKKYDLNFIIKYPFSEEAREYVASLNIKLAEIQDHPIYSAAIDLAKQRILDSVEGRKTDFGDELPEIVILSFPIARILINLINNRTAANKFATNQTELFYKFLQEETDENLAKILDELNLKFTGDKIHFTDYLKWTSDIAKQKDDFKLVNRVIEKGFVKLDKEDELILTKEAIKSKIKKPVDTKNIPDNFKNIAKTLAVEVLGDEELKINSVDADALPPCITSMVAGLAAGVVSHNSMFTLATFFVNLNLDIDNIVRIFSVLPSFNEQKTRYNIEFLAGVKSDTKYTCPACATIKSYGLCPRDCGVKHPLYYYKDYIKQHGGKIEAKEANATKEEQK